MYIHRVGRGGPDARVSGVGGFPDSQGVLNRCDTVLHDPRGRHLAATRVFAISMQVLQLSPIAWAMANEWYREEVCMVVETNVYHTP